MTGELHLAAYEQLSDLTGHMLQAARASEWDRLVALEQECRALFDNLLAQGTLGSAAGEAARRKAEILRKILADDAEIRSLTQGWMEKLQHLLGTNRQEQRLRQAYEIDPGGVEYSPSRF